MVIDGRCDCPAGTIAFPRTNSDCVKGTRVVCRWRGTAPLCDARVKAARSIGVLGTPRPSKPREPSTEAVSARAAPPAPSICAAAPSPEPLKGLPHDTARTRTHPLAARKGGRAS